MKKYYKDKTYMNIVSDILENPEFRKLSTIVHHGDNRLDHSIRVSYRSYRITKKLHLDEVASARAGLLHDFFLEDNMVLSKKKRATLLVTHPEQALKNSKKYFSISNIEEDIITTHMFPIGKKVPKYMESWVVDIVDDFASVYERGHVVCKQLTAALSFIFIFLINSL